MFEDLKRAAEAKLRREQQTKEHERLALETMDAALVRAFEPCNVILKQFADEFGWSYLAPGCSSRYGNDKDRYVRASTGRVAVEYGTYGREGIVTAIFGHMHTVIYYTSLPDDRGSYPDGLYGAWRGMRPNRVVAALRHYYVNPPTY